ncbi:MAG: nuclear transport factor 2 family protein [Chromatiales bacterium]|jgi:taurine dehydrogenase small subunit|nr:nuclear transport factor 2 family protein [Chromatiales bacterium]
MTTPRPVTIALLDEIQDGFNRHDVDAILSHFTDDCEWLMARGPDAWEGRRLKGKQAIGEVLRARYAVIPDMRWEDISHFVAADETKACSEWTVCGRPTDGSQEVNQLGCDVWTFRDGWVQKKDTYWKFIAK